MYYIVVRPASFSKAPQPIVNPLYGLPLVIVSENWRITFRFKDGDAEVVNYKYYQ